MIKPKEPPNTNWSNSQLSQMLICLVNSKFGHLYLSGMMGHGHSVTMHDLLPLWEENKAARRQFGSKPRALLFAKALEEAARMLRKQIKEQWKDDSIDENYVNET
jgi:hypothetical protein